MRGSGAGSVMPGRHFSWTGLKTAVAGSVAATSLAFAMLSAMLDNAGAQTTFGAILSPPADQLVLRFAPPPATSVREQYVGAMMFRRLLSRFALTAPAVRWCNLIPLSGERFDAIRLVVNPPRPDQRLNCLRQAVRFALQGEIGEAEFFVARQQAAKFISRWINPPARFPNDAVFASERLAYRVIYQNKSPLHQLNSITSEDYTNLRFADFVQWVNVSRHDGLITFDADPATPMRLI